MPRGLLQEAVSHDTSGTDGAPVQLLPGRCRFGGDVREDLQLPAPQHRSVAAATVGLRGQGKLRPLRVAFGDFLTLGSDHPDFQPLQDLHGGGSGVQLELPSLQLQLPSVSPTGAPRVLEVGGDAPGQGQGQVIEYWEVGGPSAGSRGHGGAAQHQGGESHAAVDAHRHGGGGGEPDRGRGDDSDVQVEKAPHVTVTMERQKPDRPLQASVIVGGAVALFAQAYLWGNVFVTLFKPNRQNLLATNRTAASQGPVLAGPPTSPGSEPSLGRPGEPSSNGGAGALFAAMPPPLRGPGYRLGPGQESRPDAADAPIIAAM
mmetsp:Transcript_18278/g.50127  ORF Transcript_18278/g.50127 Transcript_18278/m.50127 type:complete len:317 (-) Transcript_18278:94-1044(-)